LVSAVLDPPRRAGDRARFIGKEAREIKENIDSLPIAT